MLRGADWALLCCLLATILQTCTCLTHLSVLLRARTISSSRDLKASTARPATSISIRGARSTAPSSRMRIPTTPASATTTILRTPTAKVRCARASGPVSPCRRCRTAKRSFTTAYRFLCIRPATCSARHKCGFNTVAASGSLRATTRPSPTAPVRPSSRCHATHSSPNRPSACRSTVGRRRRRCSKTSTAGGGATPTRAGPR